MDDYFWLSQKERPEVLAYLRAENVYTDAVMKSTKPSRKRLRGDAGRIKEDDETVPYRREPTNTTRATRREAVPISAGKAGRLDAPRVVTLDLNRLAEGHPIWVSASTR